MTRIRDSNSVSSSTFNLFPWLRLPLTLKQKIVSNRILCLKRSVAPRDFSEDKRKHYAQVEYVCLA